MKKHIVRPRSDLMLRCSSELDSLCADIKKLGITSFSHSRIFNNGTRIDLGNKGEMLEEYYYGPEGFYRHYVPEISPRTFGDDVILLDCLQDNDCFRFLREKHHLGYMMAKVEKNDFYCDVWNFSTYHGNEDILNLYFSNLEVLILFTCYYKDKCKDLIDRCSRDPIIILEPESTEMNHSYKHELIDDVVGSLKNKTNRYYLASLAQGEYLTKAEVEYCYWIAKGYNVEDISVVTNRSSRTVEKHIENIKGKFLCKNKGQLVKLIKESRLF